MHTAPSLPYGGGGPQWDPPGQISPPRTETFPMPDMKWHHRDPSLVNRRIPVKTLPCPKLHLRAVKIRNNKKAFQSKANWNAFQPVWGWGCCNKVGVWSHRSLSLSLLWIWFQLILLFRKNLDRPLDVLQTASSDFSYLVKYQWKISRHFNKIPNVFFS